MSSNYEGHRPLVAILRGVQPHEIVEIGSALIEAGFGIIEVPLNSPDPLDSISLLADTFGSKAIVGAGTVLTPQQVDDVVNVGGRLIVSPNMNEEVIRRTKQHDGLSYPGVFTPTEAFSAIEAGADALKFFPASLHGPDGVKAIKAVLPPRMPVFAVGGVSVPTIGDWLAAGTDGFGIGSNVYKVGWSATKIASEAEAFVKAYDAAAAAQT
ncbi:MAG: 2-dehydro-3-deoxy-6-phosphogalactonate aldolase [Rhizobiaceae bacterium]